MTENIQSNKGWLIAIITTATLFTLATTGYILTKTAKPTLTPTTQETPSETPEISALGRIEPQGEVIKIGAPLILNKDRVGKWLVKEGDRVKANQPIAILDSAKRLEDALVQAQTQVRVAQSQLNQVKAGAKQGEILAQQAEIERIIADYEGNIREQMALINKLSAELKIAQADYERYQQLYKDGVISASQFDQKALDVVTNQQQLNEAKAGLNRLQITGKEAVTSARSRLLEIREIRPVDVQTAQMQVNATMANYQKAMTELKQAYILAPRDGQIIKIYTKEGEEISDENGLADLGETQQMEVVAEVYQTDINRLKVGQIAEITSDSFEGTLKGKIRQIGLQVTQQKVFSNQAGENLDRRIIEVRIQLSPEDSPKVSGLTNLQVQVTIKN